jgi:DNA-binding protein HU-beta
MLTAAIARRLPLFPAAFEASSPATGSRNYVDDIARAKRESRHRDQVVQYGPDSSSRINLTMNTSDLVTKLAETQNVTKSQAKSIVDELLKEIVAAASGGSEVSLPGFGKFKVKETAAREGRNPSTGEVIQIAASRKLTFAPAKAVKDILNV